MKRLAHALVAVILGAFALAAGAASPPAQPDASAALLGQQRFCEAEADKLKQAVEKLKAGKADLVALLAKARAEAEGKPATGTPAPAPVAQEVKLLDTLQEAAVVHQVAAAQALASAARETDPLMQRFHLKEATQRLESARRAVTRAESIVAAASPGHAPAAAREPPATRLKDDWPTLRLLKQTAAEGQGTGRFDDRAALESFAVPTDAVLAQPAGTQYFRGTPVATRLDADTGTLHLSDGRVVDVAPLRDAVAAVRPELAGRPVFEPDPALGGALRPAPEVRELMASPEGRDQLQQVGGVALEVTFESLDFARVADFRGLGPRTRIEHPVLLSLGQLYARLAPYAMSAERWAQLPQELRHPGAIARIHGFVLDAERQDIFLVAAAANDPGDRLDVDTLVLALRAVWRDGQTPAVSLDPLPDDPAGPQYPRVHNVPQDSISARIMLDADYAMKRIMLGALDPEVDGYRSGLDRVAESGETGSSRDRFWFHPVPLGVRSLRASASGRTWLFDAGLQVLTENQWLREGVLTDSGQANAGAQEDAAEFTAYLPGFETAPAVTPARVFVRLHGVLDAVAVARLWRELGIGYPLLDALARLPYRPLTAPDERVPAFYPGVYVTREIDGHELFAAGGVQLRLTPRAGAVDRYADPMAAALETAAEGFPSEHFSQPLAFSLTLARSSEIEALAAGADMRDGRSALAAGNYTEASTRFRAASARDPLDVEAWTQLATAEALAGNAAAAREALARAVELEPADPLVRVTAFEIQRRTDPVGALAALDRAARAGLEQDYVAAAYSALYNGGRDQALRFADAALELSSNNAEALLARFFARAETDTSGRRRDVVRAIRAYREQLTTRYDTPLRRRLAFALTLGAAQRTERATNAVLAAVATPDKPFDTFGAINDLDNAAAEAREARELDPDLPLAPAIEAIARGVRVPLMRAEGLQAESAAAHRLADDTIARFPDHPVGYFARAVLYLADENPQAAREALDSAVRIDPTDGRALAMRALVHNTLGECAAAKRDFDRARSLRMPFSDEDERALRACARG